LPKRIYKKLKPLRYDNYFILNTQTSSSIKYKKLKPLRYDNYFILNTRTSLSIKYKKLNKIML